MTVHVNIARAKATLSELIARAEAGEEVVLTRHGKAVARITPEGGPVNKPDRIPGAWMHLGVMEAEDGAFHSDPELVEAAEAADEDEYYRP